MTSTPVSRRALALSINFDWATLPAVLKLGIVLSVISLGLTLALMLRVVQLRAKNWRRSQIQLEVQTYWRDLLFRCVMGEMLYPMPTLRVIEREPLLLLWNQMQDSLRGHAKQRLFALAWQLGLHDNAWTLISSSNRDSQILGLATLGHLAQILDWLKLLPYIHKTDPQISLAAARALIKANPSAAVPLVIEQFLLHLNWPAARVATVLRDADPAEVAQALVQVIQSKTVNEQLRLIPLTQLADNQGQRVLAILLCCSEHPAVLAASLAKVRGEASFSRVLQLTSHPDVQVRRYAAKALHATSGADQFTAKKKALSALLTDSEWAVRYSAAQSIVANLQFDVKELNQWLEATTDLYAKEILNRAWLEACSSLDARGRSRAVVTSNADSIIGVI